MLHPTLVDLALQRNLPVRDPYDDLACVQVIVVGEAFVDVFGQALVGTPVALGSDATEAGA